MGPAEREAYLASLQEPEEIVTAPIRSVVDDVVIEDEKTAKKQIKKLMKRGKKAMKNEEYPTARENYQEAAYVATNWELSALFHEIEDILRVITIRELKQQMEKFEAQAKKAEKAKIYEEAAEKYERAAQMASQIFKMGVTEMTEKVKDFTNKYNEYKRLSE
jgi:hypothetical protein